MNAASDFDPDPALPPSAASLNQDLELDILLNAMARDDTFLFNVCGAAIFSPLYSADAIVYRQHALDDCLNNPSTLRALYSIAVEAINGEKKTYWGFAVKHPTSVLRTAVSLLDVFVPLLVRLRDVAQSDVGGFSSEAFTTLFATFERDLSADYFGRIATDLETLKFENGILLSASLGAGNKGVDYVLHTPSEKRLTWLDRLLGHKSDGYSFRLHPRDESGASAIAHINDQGINLIADAVARATDHILSFFVMLRTELAFYIGCVNLHETLQGKKSPVCFPQCFPTAERVHDARGLYDISLALRTPEVVVGNDLHASGKDLVLITGANRGGKSTFLRAIGISQLMMQCGMFVPATQFSANVSRWVLTHYKREEDTTMESGKFDEELARMSRLVDEIVPDSLLLLNESFAATNEREGSEIARQVVDALLERRVKVFFVTHLYELADGLAHRHATNIAFLRAERLPDGRRTFVLAAGEPLTTSYGDDLYEQIFGRTI